MTFFIRQLALLAVFGGAWASAQSLSLDASHGKNNNVSYLAEPATVETGKPADVEVHFRVAGGFHINSHTPLEPELIPTTLTMESAPGVKSGALQYPAGVSYAFSFAPKNKLNVYTGDFVVKIRVKVAHSGSSTWNGALRYQACDNAQCYPPKNLPITVILTAK